MPLYPRLMKILSKKVQKFCAQEVIISSFAIAKNVDLPSSTKTILYLHSPMQYIWENYQEYCKKLSGRKLYIFRNITPKLRKRDTEYTHFTQAFANSHYTASCAKSIYNLDCTIRYPPIQSDFFSFPVQESRDYYVYIGRLVRLVREVDRIIHLANSLQFKLFIIGSWPDEAYLKSIAGSSVTFLWQINDVHQRIEIQAKAKASINLAKESFGIATAESLLLWAPVFGYDGGGTHELVWPKQGLLTQDKDHDSLVIQFSKFQSMHFDRKEIADISRKKLYPTHI